MIPALGRVWAIVAMTLLEATRRKVFTILILFAAALLSSSALLPAMGAEGRLRLIEVWSLRSATLFAAIVALFVSGASLPSDFETRRIFLLVTKPASKIAVFLGRYLGFALLLAIFLGVMGLLTVGFVHAVRLSAGPGFPPLAAYPRVEATGFHPRGGSLEIRPARTVTRVEYGRDNALVYRFEGLDRSDFDGPVRGHAKLIFEKPRSFRTSGNVRIAASLPAGGAHEQVVFMQQNEEASFSVPAEAVGADGILLLSLLCDDPGENMAGWDRSVAIYERSASFELNFLRGMGLVFLQSLLVLTLTFTASTYLSSPVSILLGILLYLVGMTHSYVLEGTRDIDRSLSELDERAGKGPARTPEDLPPWALVLSTWISKAVLAVVPDFERFDFSRWLLKDRRISWGEIATAGAFALPPAIVLLLAGMLVMRFRDFG